MARDFAKAFYKSKKWQHCRDSYVLSVGGLCENCLKHGRYTPAEIVHHKEFITPSNIVNPEITLDWKNLEALCRDCHAEQHKKNSKKRYIVTEGGAIKIL